MIVTELYVKTDQIVGACVSVRALAPATFPVDLPTSKLLSGAPGWYDFEEQAWPIGEAICRSLKAAPKLRKDPAVLNALASVVRCVNLRRGRQSFVMALSTKSAAAFATELASYLTDPDIDGHALDALIKIGAGGFISQVLPLANHPQAWVRRLAKRYLERYGAA